MILLITFFYDKVLFRSAPIKKVYVTEISFEVEGSFYARNDKFNFETWKLYFAHPELYPFIYPKDKHMLGPSLLKGTFNVA